MNVNLSVRAVPRLTSEALALIKHFEACFLEAYRDPVGVLTIGYGHTASVKRGMSITPQQAENLLMEDLSLAQADVLHNVKAPLNDNEFGALVSLVFNIGGSAFARSTLARKLNRGNLRAAAAEFERFIYGRVRGRRVILKGLALRRKAEREFFEAPPGTLVRNGKMVLAGRSIPVEHPSHDAGHSGLPEPSEDYEPLYPGSLSPGMEAGYAREPGKVSAGTLISVGAGAAAGAIPATNTPASQGFVEAVTHLWEQAGGPDIFPSETAWLRWLAGLRIGVVDFFREGSLTPLLNYASDFIRSHEALIIFAITVLLFFYRTGIGGIFTSRDRRA